MTIVDYKALNIYQKKDYPDCTFVSLDHYLPLVFFYSIEYIVRI